MLPFLIISTITDLLYRKIYNIVLVPMFLMALWLQQNTLSEFFIALLISAGLILALYKLKFFAGGDTKLLIILGASVGASVGYSEMIYLFLFIFIIGGLQAIIYKYLLNQSSLPYALAILLGYLGFLIYFNPHLDYFLKNTILNKVLT